MQYVLGLTDGWFNGKVFGARPKHFSTNQQLWSFHENKTTRIQKDKQGQDKKYALSLHFRHKQNSSRGNLQYSMMTQLQTHIKIMFQRSFLNYVQRLTLLQNWKTSGKKNTSLWSWNNNLISVFVLHKQAKFTNVHLCFHQFISSKLLGQLGKLPMAQTHGLQAGQHWFIPTAGKSLKTEFWNKANTLSQHPTA